jgi:ABC-2 type transport system permease protein
VLLTSTLCAAWSFSWLVTLLARGGGVALRQVDDAVVQFLGPNVFLVGLCTLLVPLLTMNCIADERRRGTWELLLTAPVDAGSVIAGKFLAGWGLMVAAIMPWPLFLGVLRFWNGKMVTVLGFVPWFDGPGLALDPGPVICGITGIVMLTATLTAAGIFCSSVCARPISAALAALAGMGGILGVGFLPRVLALWGFARDRISWVDAFSCWGHLEQFARGTLMPRILLAHLAITVGLLWLSTITARRNDAQ